MNNDKPGRNQFYQSANADADSIRSGFMVRLHEFEIVREDLSRNHSNKSTQHYLFLGKRGSGKSTLLKRIQIEIDSDILLQKKYIAINLAEEQANIYKLFDLLNEIIQEIEHLSTEAIPQWSEDSDEYTKNLFAYIHRVTAKSGKKIVLLLDNIDRVFENIQDESSLLREHLLNYDDLKIIGASTRMHEHFWNYDKPFYQFFRVIELGSLSCDEVRSLLIHWSEKLDLPDLKTFVQTQPGRLEAIRILTDGLPRTLLFFVNILLSKAQESTYEYLQFVMDNVTPQYQERLNSLAPAQRKIVLQMAFIWEASGAATIGAATKMTNSVVSAQLKQLNDKGLVDKISTGTKNHLYRLSERFFNLWLIFTQGSPNEKRRARYLTIFLENFYSKDEIAKLAQDHLNQLKHQSLSPNKAAIMTKAFAQSRYITSIIRDRLIETTLQIQDISKDLLSQLPKSTTSVLQEIAPFFKQKQLDKINQILSSIEQDDGFHEYVRGNYYLSNEMFGQAKAAFEESLSKGLTLSYAGLAEVATFEKDFDEAIKQYKRLLAIFEIPGALVKLGRLLIITRRPMEAREFFERAVVLDPSELSTIGLEYLRISDFESAARYVEHAISLNQKGSHLAMTMVLYLQAKNPTAALDYLMKDLETVGPSDINKFFKILVSVWVGNFKNIQNELNEFVTKNIDHELTPNLIQGLLHHGQTNLVIQLFTSLNASPSLREKFTPLYYATLAIAQGEIDKKMPPELLETVNRILEQVSIMKKNFSSKSE